MNDPDGTLGVYAGGNITTVGAQIVSSGSVAMTAKGDTTLDSVTTDQSESIHWSSRNSRINGRSTETGTAVNGAANATIKADGNISARAAQLRAGYVLSVDASCAALRCRWQLNGGSASMAVASADRSA